MTSAESKQCKDEAGSPENKRLDERTESIQLSARDFAFVLELLNDPPEPNAKLMAAIASLPETL